MIQLQRMTPSVYYEQSRDFQYIGRLFDLVLNSVKTNTELVNNLYCTQLIDLLCMTLGFKQKHNYNVKQLVNVCSIFSEILRNKGSKKSIELVCNAILQAEGITEAATIQIKDYEINITIPDVLSDINLLKDVLNYIIPAGISCNIIKAVSEKTLATTVVHFGQVSATITGNLKDTVLYTVNDKQDAAGGNNGRDTDASTHPGYIMNGGVISYNN